MVPTKSTWVKSVVLIDMLGLTTADYSEYKESISENEVGFVYKIESPTGDVFDFSVNGDVKKSFITYIDKKSGNKGYAWTFANQKDLFTNFCESQNKKILESYIKINNNGKKGISK